jgi:hypothetical protein
MANSPTDKSNDFVQSGMTLITQVESDYWLNKSAKENELMHQTREFLSTAEWDDGFVGK